MDKKGCNVVHWAAYSGSLAILKILDQTGVLSTYKDKQDDMNQTPLIKSFFTKNIEVMKLLIKSNCNLYIRDFRGNTAEEFIQRYLQDINLYQEFLRQKHRQFLRSCTSFSEVKNGFQKDRIFISEAWNHYYSKYSHILPIVQYGILIFLILVTHWYYRSAAGGDSSFLMSIFRLLYYVMILGSIGLFGLFFTAACQYIPRLDVDDKDSIIRQILKSIEDLEFSKIVPLKEICFDTNMGKIKHGEF